MNSKNKRTLTKLFRRPVANDIRWQDIERMLVAMGAEVSEGRGSRIRVLLNGEVATFHRPHPRPTTDKGAIVALCEFLEQAGVRP
ncbi:MAG: type II toxin-antitoxin system HicA family toxin [Roseitalea sp.]|uniref:Type II toxin-antitoxin system HicA family toxin n=2 Tax=Oceaniradius stylonematis TaxID=2184161 RepID=A0A3A8ACQ0_9HYPH|nr:type II toxin-antitoxin system HicA family toxin [Oceaniradius stylonematis]MBO6552287.1 type II toxin-antitoxin system HicA family toxin [Roseitalea sp.]MBO6950793.1 type II toxin-antitoxin system HicA family toxin [Rhizobiaceae bacterium]MBO6591220.1 type II toxin-antitoxin system HicA family toxin [Roseitalea sp.]MBO6599075.1 type II toxin-antitoxin system HicA family toxin [Roseitalea sp.]MBO6613485.1 type II toxin-antitoxin system HicA family toxin [Roseitalea sp.]